jgi:NADH-quinone oxidoreductase subunit M
MIPAAPWEALAFCLLLLIAPAVASQQRAQILQLSGLVIALVVTLFSPSPQLAYGAVAAAAVLHAIGAAPTSRTGAAMLTVTAVLALAAAGAIRYDALTAAFVLSCLALALRAGLLPFHAGVASLCDRAPVIQTQQLASTIALVFVHLRFVDHHAGAVALAPAIVRYGAAATIAAALMAVVQRDLRGLYRGTTTMHGGMLLAAIGAASLDNFAAALLVAVAMGLAIGGLGIVVMSLEERVGPVTFADGGGRLHAFPRLTVAFALFGAAGVGLPGTAGFVADDLLLHTLWKESPASAVVVILASAVLAVATLKGYSKVFLGRPVTSLAPDLLHRERVVAVMLVLLLMVLGFAPRTLLGPADTFLSPPPVTTAVRPSPF